MSLIVRVTGLILALAVGCVSAIAALVTYTPSSDDINNPERGFYRHTERRSTDSFPLDPALLASFRAGGSSVIIRVIYLERFVTAPIDAPYLALLQDDFNAIRQAGLKVVIRFAYTDVYHETPPYGDASKPQVLAHIAQLEPLLRSNADVIAVVQAGFIGTWGEWYYTDWFVADPTQPWNITPADYANRREVLYRLLDALPTSRPTQLRTPTYKQQVLQTTQPVSPAQAFSGSYFSRTGHHNDCYLASDTDFGTYPDASQSQYPYLSADTLYTPMGGETCNPNPPRSDCPTALSEFALFHWSFVNKDYHPGVLSAWTTQGCTPTIQRRLGYRFTLLQGEYTDAARPGDAIHASIVLRNDGWAAPYLPRTVQLLLRSTSSGAVYAATSIADPRLWLPSSSTTHTLTIDACTSASLPPGTYERLLNLPDPARALRTRADYSVAMANDGSVREATTGYNRLWSNLTVSPSAPAAPCNTATRFVPFAGTPAEIAGVRWSSHTQLVWTADAASSRYHVYRDDVTQLANAAPRCNDELDSNPTDTRLDDSTVPSPGRAFYYLISGEAPNATEGVLGPPNPASCLL